MQTQKPTPKSFRPFKLQDTSTLTPDHPAFHAPDINLAILTKYSRGIYIRHGNEDRCSSFFATLGTIVNKLEMSFGKAVEGTEVPATLKCIRHGALKFYVVRRLNYMYICWSKGTATEAMLLGMMEFVHIQLQSCLTGKVNAILDTNQTYDPSINFGKNKTEHLLLHYAFTNGLYSLPVVFNAIPVMPLSSQARLALLSLLKQQKIQGLQINIVMTMSQIICVHKQKGVDLTPSDIFLLNTLIQSQSSLFSSQIWYPICLPGVFFEDRVFCYINHLTDKLIHIMVADQANIFPELSEASKRLKDKIDKSLMERINLSADKQIITDPSLQKPIFLKHFLCRFAPSDQNSLPQMLMSSGCYFGQNDPQLHSLIPLYGDLHQQYATHRTGKKQKVHVQPLGQYVGGYCEQGNVAIFFIAGGLAQLEDCRAIGAALSRWVKEEDHGLWLHKLY